MATFYHVSHSMEPMTAGLKPSRFDVNGRMDCPAVFVTDSAHVNSWISWVKDKYVNGGRGKNLFLYAVDVDPALIKPGPDGDLDGDYKIETDKPLPCRFVRIIGEVDPAIHDAFEGMQLED